MFAEFDGSIPSQAQASKQQPDLIYALPKPVLYFLARRLPVDR